MRPLFRDRLKEAAAYAGIEYSPTAMGRSLGISKQTVHAWMDSSEPRPAMLFHIADSWRVDARWLATGDGSMAPPPSGPGLSADEIEMVKRFRKAEPRNRPSILAVAKSLARVVSLVAFVSTGALGFNNKLIAAPLLAQNATVITIVKSWLRAFLRSLLRYKALRFSACRGFATTT